MDLVTRFLAARRDKLLMKLGCWLVCFSLVLGLMLPQQKAEALVAELSIAAVASVAAAYLGACGLTVVVSGMDKDALVSNVQRLINEFLTTELGGISIQDWLGSVWDVAVLAGKIMMGRSLTDQFATFAQWVAQKYGVQVGENVVYSGVVVDYADGSIVLTQVSDKSLIGPNKTVPAGGFVLGTPMELGTSKTNCPVYQFSPGYTLRSCRYYSSGDLIYAIGSTKGSDTIDWGHLSSAYQVSPFYLVASSTYLFSCSLSPDGALLINALNWAIPLSRVDGYTGEASTLGIDRAGNPVYIPEGIGAEQGIALDVGLGAVLGATEVFEGILDKVIAGDLEATMTAADEAVEPVDPPAEELPDVDDLGLPALGAALTSRFPFSIPWDFFRAVQLLAAPAKAPYFEVDFMEPLADDVGGWQGDTTVVLDFSEYAIIGQISRWTSTIGFCLMLAGATKRLIWTA